jgi:DNA-binding SARP family transcriptional activator
LEAGKDGQVSLGPRLALVTESVRLEATLAEAARLQGEERLSATLEALKVFDRGEYLPGVPSPWAEERRAHLREVVCTARHEAAELAFAAGRLELARALAEEVLREEPFHEAAWRLTMRLADALGDEAGVFRAYQRCEDALGSVGTVPSPTTRELLVRLRR